MSGDRRHDNDTDQCNENAIDKITKKIGLKHNLKIITPRNLTDRQKEILREFSNEREEHLTEHKKNFFEKVKELFD